MVAHAHVDCFATSGILQESQWIIQRLQMNKANNANSDYKKNIESYRQQHYKIDKI